MNTTTKRRPAADQAAGDATKKQIYVFKDGRGVPRRVEITDPDVLECLKNDGARGGIGRPVDEDAARAPSGAKSRSKRAQLAERLREPAAQKRLAHFSALGVTEEAASFAALGSMASHPAGMLRLLDRLTPAQWNVARMLQEAGAVLAPQSPQSQLAGFSDLGCHVDSGRRIGAAAEPSADDEPRARAAEPFAPELCGSPVDYVTFAGLVAAYAKRGLTPAIAVAVARGAVLAACHADAWRLLDGLFVSGGSVPGTATLPLLRAALDAVGAALTPHRSIVGMNARECFLVGRSRVLTATFKSATPPNTGAASDTHRQP